MRVRRNRKPRVRVLVRGIVVRISRMGVNRKQRVTKRRPKSRS